MAYSFKKSGVVNIEIEDKSYPAKITRELGKRLSKLSLDTDSDNTVSYIDRLIDEILGDGKAAEIFAGREEDEFERLDVLKYICGELTKASDKIKRNISK